MCFRLVCIIGNMCVCVVILALCVCASFDLCICIMAGTFRLMVAPVWVTLNIWVELLMISLMFFDFEPEYLQTVSCTKSWTRWHTSSPLLSTKARRWAEGMFAADVLTSWQEHASGHGLLKVVALVHWLLRASCCHVFSSCGISTKDQWLKFCATAKVDGVAAAIIMKLLGHSCGHKAKG